MRDRVRFSLFARRPAGMAPRRATVRLPLAAAAGLALLALLTGCGQGGPSQGPSAPAAPSAPAPPAPRALTMAQLSHLPKATTYAHLKGAATDPQPYAADDSLVVHPSRPTVVYASPGGPPTAVLPATEMGSPTWVPVVQSQPGWDMVLLPSRPNRSAGWIPSTGGSLRSAHTAYLIRVNREARRLTLVKDGKSVGTWPVAVGAPGTPTPSGRTFVLASLVPAQPTYSWLILPTGAHSDSLETYGGGPGTVGLHTWPDASVFGHAVSHGCVRVPAAGLRMLSHVPLGSLVVIS